MALYPVSGSKFYIGLAAVNEKSADFVAADFSGVSWTEVSKWTQMGTLGDSAQLITSDIIAEARTKKAKGTRNAGSMQNVFNVDPVDPGQLLLIAAEKTGNNYPFRMVMNDAQVPRTSVATMTIASPGVVSWANHGLVVGQGVNFTTTGALPTGVVPGTTYYVIATGFTANSFQMSATPGGAAVVTTGSQSGVHTAYSVPTGSERLFIGLVMQNQEVGGSANTVNTINSTIEVNSNVVRVANLT